jgi:hypothetical protein
MFADIVTDFKPYLVLGWVARARVLVTAEGPDFRARHAPTRSRINVP